MTKKILINTEKLLIKFNIPLDKLSEKIDIEETCLKIIKATCN
jgi:hypothetical protein